MALPTLLLAPSPSPEKGLRLAAPLPLLALPLALRVRGVLFQLCGLSPHRPGETGHHLPLPYGLLSKRRQVHLLS